MTDLNEIFQKIAKKKKERREIKTIYMDTLKNSKGYQDICEQLDTLKEKKRAYENETKAQFISEFNKLDDLKTDITSDTQMLNDLALTQLMKGETVEIVADAMTYEPVFSVRFKKKNG